MRNRPQINDSGYFGIHGASVTMFDLIGKNAGDYGRPIASASCVTNSFQGYLYDPGKYVGVDATVGGNRVPNLYVLIDTGGTLFPNNKRNEIIPYYRVQSFDNLQERYEKSDNKELMPYIICNQLMWRFQQWNGRNDERSGMSWFKYIREKGELIDNTGNRLKDVLDRYTDFRKAANLTEDGIEFLMLDMLMDWIKPDDDVWEKLRTRLVKHC